MPFITHNNTDTQLQTHIYTYLFSAFRKIAIPVYGRFSRYHKKIVENIKYRISGISHCDPVAIQWEIKIKTQTEACML